MTKRAKWKGPYISYTFYQLLLEKKHTLVIQDRSATIVPALLGKTVKVYNGKIYFVFKVSQEMLGYKVGSFSSTDRKSVV